jgi:3,4-dihydroxy 2-butanone 4-phosphate synthase / GTP cyclohydrolase II
VTVSESPVPTPDQPAPNQTAPALTSASTLRSPPTGTFDSVESALADLKAGRCIVVVDDENRENEGDLIGAAQFATPDMINFMATEARGLICLAMTGDRLDQLDLPLMVTHNTDSNQTAFTVSIDAGPNVGVTTGISAEDRARTIQVTLHPDTRPMDLRRPGHIFPLRAKAGGVLKRAGHTEAAVDLAQMAGLYPAGVICEIQNSDGSMARLPELIDYAHRHRLKLISIADLISYRLQHERFIQREAVADLPTQFGHFHIFGYRNRLDASEHVAIVRGDPATFKDQTVMVRVHSECLTGDALGSLRCDCRLQLQAALKMIDSVGTGVVVYLRQEGRGIGLVNKLKAYSLQDLGLDTVEANEKLGFPADLRNYGVGAQILNDLGIQKIRLVTNNPRKIAGLKGYGLEVVDRVPLLMEATSYNEGYLSTKADKLGHLMLHTYLGTVALYSEVQAWSVEQRYQLLEQVRQWAADCRIHTPQGTYALAIQEEARPLALAVFNGAVLMVHVGLAQPLPEVGVREVPDLQDLKPSQDLKPAQDLKQWHRDPQSSAYGAIAEFLQHLKHYRGLEQVELIVATGQDPLQSLQVQLARMPLEVGKALQTQSIYTLAGDSQAALNF